MGIVLKTCYFRPLFRVNSNTFSQNITKLSISEANIKVRIILVFQLSNYTRKNAKKEKNLKKSFYSQAGYQIKATVVVNQNMPLKFETLKTYRKLIKHKPLKRH